MNLSRENDEKTDVYVNTHIHRKQKANAGILVTVEVTVIVVATEVTEGEE